MATSGKELAASAREMRERNIALRAATDERRRQSRATTERTRALLDRIAQFQTLRISKRQRP